jgi:hypothetical protein
LVAQAGSDAEQALTAAHQALLRRRDIQFDFPTYAPPTPRRPAGWLEPLLKLFESLSPVMLWVFLGGLALGAALLLYFLLRELFYSRMPGRKKPGAAAEEPDWRPTEAAARTLLEDADRLAGEGRFGEAVHLLLFRCIEDMAQRKPGLVRPALTSRDLARAEALPPAARDAFAAIAAAVERSFFGGRPVDAEGFADCRRAYEDFALPGAWR